MDDDAVFKALADAGRRDVLDALRHRNGQTLGELTALMPMTRQGASRHLAVLEEAGLVVAVREGREKRLYLNPVPIAAIARRWIAPFEQSRMDALSDLKAALEDPVDERAALRLRHPHRRAG